MYQAYALKAPRKRRCDATRPRCNNCARSEVECHYDDGPSQRIDTSGGTREILSRLRDIRAVLDEQTQHLASFSATNSPQIGPQLGQANAASTTSHGSISGGSIGAMQLVDTETAWLYPSLEARSDAAGSEPMNIPVQHKTSSSYLLGLPAMKALIGEYPPNLFFLLESRSQLPPELSLDQWPTSLPSFQVEQMMLDHLVSSFFSLVHVCHPILDQTAFNKIYQGFLEKGADSSIESALCMVVFALGAVSTSPAGQCDPGNPPVGTEYMQYAIPTLMSRSLWSFSFDPILAQALVLASIYFAYIVRPLHSWRLIYSATNLLQFKLSNLESQKHALNSEGILLRLFWSCFMIECDRLAELELPRSSLQQLTDDASLPQYDNLEDVHSTAFLGEITIRRLLNRIHNSLYPRKPHPLGLSLSSTCLMTPDEFSLEEISSVTAVCEELHHQLDAWHEAIPEQFRPPLGLEKLDNARISILRIRYFAARHIIYRPFVLYVATHNEPMIPNAIIEKAGICIESCKLYLYHTSDILKTPSQYTWTFALSSLGAVIILTLSWLSEELRGLIPDIDDFQTLAIENVRPWAVSSLSDVLSILEEIRRKTRLRARV
ncbi:hypothetical protein S40293_06598 [Stachybotrys chartarum IBT 40293]|nr:hypothetical protein S40293_06598 [Stachybotrys chartarum IBT 40293]